MTNECPAIRLSRTLYRVFGFLTAISLNGHRAFRDAWGERRQMAAVSPAASSLTDLCAITRRWLQRELSNREQIETARHSQGTPAPTPVLGAQNRHCTRARRPIL